MFCWPYCLKLERVCIFSMAIPRKPCWNSFSLLTPAGHSSSSLAHPLVSIKMLLFPSKTQTAASESPYQHNIPLNSGRLIWIYFLAAVCLNYISTQLAMMSIATKIPENPADWFPMSRKMSFAHVPHALGCHIKRFSLIQERLFYWFSVFVQCQALPQPFNSVHACMTRSCSAFRGPWFEQAVCLCKVQASQLHLTVFVSL